jgi:flap endonuclease-1
MGITGFSKFFSEILVKKDISELKNKIVIIDTVYILYKYCIAIRNSGKDYVNKNGNLSSHLIALFNLATFLLKNKITPIFVFDGKTPEIKNTQYKKEKKEK